MKTRSMALAVAILTAAWAAPAASADSIAYIKDGNIRIAPSDLSGAVNLTSDGGWTLVTQGDDGTIVGMKDDVLYRLGRDGRVVNEITGHTITKPTHIELSPSGRLVAVSGPTTCSTSSIGSRICFRTSHIASDGSGAVEASHEGDEASWIGDGTVVLWGRATAYTNAVGDGAQGSSWFDDDEFKNLYAGEVSRAGDKLVAVRGDEGEFLRFYAMTGPPPAAPTPRCERGGAGRKFADPTWSPDGNRLAWAEADGVHVAAAPSLADCSRDPAESVISGATSPDWGAAGVPTVAAGGGGDVFSSSHSNPSRLRRSVVLRRGVPVTVECSATCAFKVTLKLGRKSLGAKASSIGGGGTKKVTVRLSRAGKRLLGRARLPAKVRVVVTVSDGSERYVGSTRLTVKR